MKGDKITTLSEFAAQAGPRDNAPSATRRLKPGFAISTSIAVKREKQEQSSGLIALAYLATCLDTASKDFGAAPADATADEKARHQRSILNYAAILAGSAADGLDNRAVKSGNHLYADVATEIRARLGRRPEYTSTVAYAVTP